MLELAETPTAAAVDQVRHFFDHDYARVLGVVATATSDRAAAEDALQDALVKFMHLAETIERPSAWIAMVAMNGVRQAHRRKATERRVTPQPRKFAPDATDSLVQQSAISDALKVLPQRQRQMVLLHYYLDASIADIAQAMEVGQSTVKTHLARARKKLAKTLRLEDEVQS